MNTKKQKRVHLGLRWKGTVGVLLLAASSACGPEPVREQPVVITSALRTATAPWLGGLGLRVLGGDDTTEAREPGNEWILPQANWTHSEGKSALGEVIRLEGQAHSYQEFYLVMNETVGTEKIKSAFFTYRRSDSQNRHFGSYEKRVAGQDRGAWFVPLGDRMNEEGWDADPGDLHVVDLDLHFDSGIRRLIRVELRVTGDPTLVSMEASSAPLERAFRTEFRGGEIEVAQVLLTNPSESHSRSVWFRKRGMLQVSQYIVRTAWFQRRKEDWPEAVYRNYVTNGKAELKRMVITGGNVEESVIEMEGDDWQSISIPAGEVRRVSFRANRKSRRCGFRRRELRHFARYRGFFLGVELTTRYQRFDPVGWSSNLDQAMQIVTTRSHDRPPLELVPGELPEGYRLRPLFGGQLRVGRVPARASRAGCQGFWKSR